ncbi:Protein kinase domain and Adenylyl cyclase class-3/4/guanylyl cyclase domain and Serine-threonine/tyrosine-protein kinase catalytic domain and Extracellular ligand-binding receptor domain and Protein kinase-like domain and Periplasmic binding protein-like I domain-containing protein [Strongyloides ratti]|uniref:Guanylate cyclase n=1 Tax=Strongyloides ratti TaxID=34506 RepID=A0A090N0R7_STRRB|nr:Protein kinase domain and Adenylyl cyclase class-3/4/guanylyl cyclase domain and Serine-threonine/tyrosine-protein kinase catalytic domain and Extracellular ligand-binding receptor domain and Protein kinase-like domain and Periplasmic binding protein-like I domain-containing protein [Strongyloides ratti]CEF71158.1 Protein kinase domain and Adenylyl cyclase class-3/4/guanylyl cyclase domain and Serine-threonine/tyrosine-protein kinase catalytic domain and Extracellular ligand-binding receptor do
MINNKKLYGIIDEKDKNIIYRKQRNTESSISSQGKKIITISYLSAISVFPRNLYDYIKTVTNSSNSNNLFKKKSDKLDIFSNYNYVSKCFKADFDGSLISGALKFAIDEINSNENLLPDYYIKYVFNNTCDDETLSTKYFMDHWKSGVSAFIGPEMNCRTEAQMAAAQNLPIIAYKCKDEVVSNKLKYPTFARTVPAESAIAKTVVATLKEMNWKKVALIYEEATSYSKLVDSIKLIIEQQNRHLKVNNKYEILSINTIPSPFSEFNDNKFDQIVGETKDYSRIYLVVGTPKMGRKLTKVMGDKNILSSGLYLILLVCPDYDWLNTYHAMNNHFFRDTSKWLSKSWDVNNSDDHKFLTYAQYVLAIIPTPVSLNNPQVKFFWKKCNENLKYFGIYGNPFEKEIKPNRHAYYLYDAVMLYAKSLHEVVKYYKKNGFNTDLAIKDGRMIMSHIIGKRYFSIQGFEMKINKNGNAIGNYSLISLQKVEPIYDKNNPNYYPIKYALDVTADFVDVDDGLLTLPKMRYHKKILWPRTSPPIDEPICGFMDDKCSVNIFLKYIWAFFFFFFFCLLGSYLGFKHYYEKKLRLEEIPNTWKIDIKKIEKISKNNDTFKSLLFFDEDSGIFSDEFTKILARYIPKSTFKKNKSLECGNQKFSKLSGIGLYEGSFVVVKEFTYDHDRKIISDSLKKECNVMKQLRNDNINNFLGLLVGPYSIYAVREFCGRCSLMDVYKNNDFKLDNLFISSFIDDLVKGMLYLQNTEIKIHGNLKSTNCLITNRFALQLSDFGLYELRYGQDFKTEELMWEGLLWTAPELINFDDVARPKPGTQEGDVYSFGIILHELVTGDGPFRLLSKNNICAAEIIKNIVEDDNFRPDTKFLNCPKFVIKCMKECWQKCPKLRPTFQNGIRQLLLPMLEQVMKNNLMDNMMALMDVYQNQLEDLVERRTLQLQNEKRKSEALLQRMLPPSVANQLIKDGKVRPEFYKSVTIYFSDIVGFTDLANFSTPIEIVSFLNDLYTMFDSIIKKYEVYKVETIGDAYMVVAGCPKYYSAIKQAEEIASMALHILACSSTFVIKHKKNEKLSIRIGIHSGCVAAGVVGKTMPRYCLFGDTVNTASRMETTGSGMKIHCSIDTRSLLESKENFLFEHRGFQYIKGKKPVLTYWLLGRLDWKEDVYYYIDSKSDDLNNSKSCFIKNYNKNREKLPLKYNDDNNSIFSNISLYKIKYFMNQPKSNCEYEFLNEEYNIVESLKNSHSSEELSLYECRNNYEKVFKKTKANLLKKSLSFPILKVKKPWNDKKINSFRKLTKKSTTISTMSILESVFSDEDYNNDDSRNLIIEDDSLDYDDDSDYTYENSDSETSSMSSLMEYRNFSYNDNDILKNNGFKDNKIIKRVKSINYDSCKGISKYFRNPTFVEYKSLSKNSSFDEGYMDRYAVNKSILNDYNEYDLEAAKSWNNSTTKNSYFPVHRNRKSGIVRNGRNNKDSQETNSFKESLITKALSIFNQRKGIRKNKKSNLFINEGDLTD